MLRGPFDELHQKDSGRNLNAKFHLSIRAGFYSEIFIPVYDKAFTGELRLIDQRCFNQVGFVEKFSIPPGITRLNRTALMVLVLCTGTLSCYIT